MPIKFLLFMTLVTSPVFGKSLLELHCNERGGRVVSSFQCPKSKLPIKWAFCISESPSGKRLFFDGCTGPSGGHTELFYPACIQHDYCYHHEPLSNGMSRKDCDDEFLKNTLAACEDARDPSKCRKWAQTMYRALRGFGELAFNCEKSVADYRE